MPRTPKKTFADNLDYGHERLVTMLQELLDEARAGEFHDFKNTRYAAPKVELDKKLRMLADLVRSGEFDNGTPPEKPTRHVP